MKNKYTTILFFVFFSAVLYGQKTINVNFYKTSHIIFPASISYKSAISDMVATNIPAGVKNVLQIKANKKNFGNTNLSVATSDGKFYNYILAYTDARNNTVINESKRKIKSVETLRLNTSSQVHFILPAKIAYVDYGDTGIVAKHAENTENIIMAMAKSASFPETNVSFATTSGDFYTYNVQSGNPEKFVYDFSNKSEVLISDQKRIRNIDHILKSIYSLNRKVFNIGQREGSVVFSLDNIISNKDVLYFVFTLNNKSSLTYDVKYLKIASEFDRSSKKVASQDEYSEILLKDRWKDRILAKNKNKFLIAIPKTSLGNKQVLKVYLSEKSGARNFILKIPNSILNDAQYLELE